MSTTAVFTTHISNGSTNLKLKEEIKDNKIRIIEISYYDISIKDEFAHYFDVNIVSSIGIFVVFWANKLYILSKGNITFNLNSEINIETVFIIGESMIICDQLSIIHRCYNGKILNEYITIEPIDHVLVNGHDIVIMYWDGVQEILENFIECE